jgi:hypothetical protein
MNNPITFGSDDSRELREIMAQFDAPAYVRRARHVEGTYEDLLERCRKHRQEWLTLVRTRLGQLAALSNEWEALRPNLCGEEALRSLRRLHDDLRPELRVAPAPTNSLRALRRAAVVLRTSIRRFNLRWASFLAELDLAPINKKRDDYNRYYVLEKECALRSPRLAREGFRQLQPLTLEHLEALFPPLPVFRLTGEDSRPGTVD